MLDLLRAWDVAQEDMLVFDPEEKLCEAVKKLLARKETGKGSACGVVQDKQGRFLGTLSTHRALRTIGHALHDVGSLHAGAVDQDRAVHAVCHMVGGYSVGDCMYTKTLQVPPATTVQELLRLFARTTAHYAVVVDAGRALGLLDLDDIFKTFAREMLSQNPVPI